MKEIPLVKMSFLEIVQSIKCRTLHETPNFSQTFIEEIMLYLCVVKISYNRNQDHQLCELILIKLLYYENLVGLHFSNNSLKEKCEMINVK